VGVTSTVLVGASIFKIEEAIPAAGKLEPQGAVQPVKSATGGVVRQILVKDGQRVKKDQLLLTFDPTTPQADRHSLLKLRQALVQENQFYAGGGGSEYQPLTRLRNVLVKENQFYAGTGGADLAGLQKLRSALVAENQFYTAQREGRPMPGNSEFAAHQRLLQDSQAENQSRAAAARLEVLELEEQLRQTQEQLVLAKQVLALNQTVLNRVSPLVQEGALSQLQYEKQQQDVLNRQGEVKKLMAEQNRLRLAIAQSREKLHNTTAISAKEASRQVTENQKRIAEIDSQFERAKLDNDKQIAQIDVQHTQAMLENQKRIAEIDAQLVKTNQTLEYQELRSPVDGVVFDMQAKAPGFVATASEPILSVVPDQQLVATIYIPNRDIGFVRQGMTADVRIDAFPFSQFGDVKGKLIWIGSDALPPTEIRPFYSFPAKVQLQTQSLVVKERKLSLQSGMSVSVNLKIRKRTIMSIFTDLFAKEMESLKFIR